MEAEEIVELIPEWADGLIIVPTKGQKGWFFIVYPLKKSQFDDSYFFSRSWKRVWVEDYEVVKNLGRVVVLRDGSIHKYRRGKGKSKYITIHIIEGEGEEERERMEEMGKIRRKK